MELESRHTNFWLENKRLYNSLCVFIVISALLFLIHLLLLQKSLANPAFVYILYDEYSDDVRGELSSAKYTT